MLSNFLLRMGSDMAGDVCGCVCLGGERRGVVVVVVVGWVCVEERKRKRERERMEEWKEDVVEVVVVDGCGRRELFGED